MVTLPDHGTVTSEATGRLIPCCWAECSAPGRAEYSIRVVESKDSLGRPVKTTTYLFCCHRHRLYYANGHLDYGQLPDGLRSEGGRVTVPDQAWKKGTP